MDGYLNLRLCDIANVTSTQTILEYVRDLEDQASTTHEDLTGMSEAQIDEYIEWLYLACII